MAQRYQFRPLRRKVLCAQAVTGKVRNNAAAFDFAMALLVDEPTADEIAVRLGEVDLFTVKRAN